MDRLNLSDNIIRLRRERRITQEELADFLGVSKAAVSKWENAQSTPDLSKQMTAYIPDNPDLYEYLTGIQYLNFIADIFKVPAGERAVDFGRAFCGA